MPSGQEWPLSDERTGMPVPVGARCRKGPQLPPGVNHIFLSAPAQLAPFGIQPSEHIDQIATDKNPKSVILLFVVGLFFDPLCTERNPLNPVNFFPKTSKPPQLPQDWQKYLYNWNTVHSGVTPSAPFVPSSRRENSRT
jgi:hypothetical protein